MQADSGLAVCYPQCQSSRLVVGSAILITTICRAWRGWRAWPRSCVMDELRATACAPSPAARHARSAVQKEL